MPQAAKLLELAAARFYQDIWPAEQRVFEAVASGEVADCIELAEKDRIIRADRLSWLCTNREASAQVTHRGLSISGAKIDGKVDLAWAKISFPITAFKCVFKDTIILSYGHIAYLNFEGSAVTDLKAVATHFEEHVFLRNGFRADGGVDLIAAKIDGNLACEGGKLIGIGETPALDADSAKIEGGAYFRKRFSADGLVNSWLRTPVTVFSGQTPNRKIKGF